MVENNSTVKVEGLYSEETVQHLHQRIKTDPIGAYLEEVTARFRCLFEQPGWDPGDPLCIWMGLETAVTCFPAEQMIQRGLEAEDWQSLNDTNFQSVRLQTFGLRLNPGEEFWYFFQALTAIAVGDDGLMEWIFPAGMEKKVPKKVYPLYRVGAPLLAGLWYQDRALLEFAVPNGETFAASKKPQWDRAVISYLLALCRRDVKEAGKQLQTLCQTVTRVDVSWEKEPFLPAHGLYRLAARVLSGEEFDQLAMPDYKTFSRGYARWRGTPSGTLALPYPEPMEFVNKALTGVWPPRQC